MARGMCRERGESDQDDLNRGKLGEHVKTLWFLSLNWLCYMNLT